MEKKLKYSIEEIFQKWGHNDKTVLILFHPNSNAYKKYGKSIAGNFFYDNTQEETYKTLLLSKENNDGILKFIPTRTFPLSEDQKKDLKEEGFKASDIYEIQVVTY